MRETLLRRHRVAASLLGAATACSSASFTAASGPADGGAGPADAASDDGEGGTEAGAGVDAHGDAGAICGDPSTRRLVFVTASTFTGNLGGRSGADAKCSEAAKAAGITTPTGWYAFVSTEQGWPGVPASPTRPIVRVDCKEVAPSFYALANTLETTIDVDEGRVPVVDNGYTWSATTANGGGVAGIGPAETCDEWIDGTSVNGYSGIVGNVAMTDSRWANDGQQQCGAPAHLYCFEE